VNEGSSFSLSLTNPQDAGLNDTTFTYQFDCGDGLGYGAADAATSATCPTTDNGSRSVKAKILDDDGGSSEYTATVQVVNVPPAFATGSPNFDPSQVSCAAAGNATLKYAFTDPGADTWTAFIDWNYNGTTFSPDPVTGQSITNKTGSFTHSYSSAGVHTAAIKIVDDDAGETALGQAPLTVLFNTSGILQPVNDTRNGQPVSLFKFKSTVPVKVQIQDCDGSYPSSLAPTVSVWLSSSSPPPTGTEEVASTVPPTTGNTMRFTGAPDNQYIYNLATKNLSDSSATYNIRVTIPQTGQTINATLGLKP
jgi:uncharacterized protein